MNTGMNYIPIRPFPRQASARHALGIRQQGIYRRILTGKIGLGNPEVLRAESLSFEDATVAVRNFLEQITLDNCFEQESWKKMNFFARIRADNDIVPVRAEYNEDGVTKNIGVNYFTSSESIWLSGPDVIASKLLAGKVPHIEKAVQNGAARKTKGIEIH